MTLDLTSILTMFRLSESAMKRWPVQDAKARFSAFLKASLDCGPQLVTMRGKEAAVLVGIEEWRRLSAQARPGLKSLLLSPDARAELPTRARGRVRRRSPRAGN